MNTRTQSPSTASSRGLLAGTLALIGALGAIPLVLAQLDFAGLVNVFSIDTDAPRGLLIVAGIGACLTAVVIAVAVTGAALALTGSRYARPVLIASAIAGFGPALMLWLPNALALAGAAALLPPGPDSRPDGH